MPAEMSTIGAVLLPSEADCSRMNSPAGWVSSRTSPTMTWSINMDDTTPGLTLDMELVLAWLEFSDESADDGVPGLLDEAESVLEEALQPRSRRWKTSGELALTLGDGAIGAVAAVEEEDDRGI